MRDALAARRAEQTRLMELAREFVGRVSRRTPVVAATVVGSVARGDFNVWSDIDVVVIGDGLPEDALERQTLMVESAPPGVQVVALTQAEFGAAVAKGNRLAREALESGVPLAGAEFFAAQRAVSP